jgi:FkbM family methyltransferase
MFDLDIDADPFMRAVFDGSYQADVLSVVRRYVRRGGSFIDVGANIGYVSAFAMGQVGPTGLVHAFEPVPQCCLALLRLRDLNPEYSLHIHQVACGTNDSEGQIMVAGRMNNGAHTMVSGVIPTAMIASTIPVKIVSLGDFLAGMVNSQIDLIKIDTEGFEYPVLKGLETYWQRTHNRPPLLVEVAPCAYPQVGVTLGDLESLVTRYGYRAWHPVYRSRSVRIRELHKTTDVLLLAE